MLERVCESDFKDRLGPASLNIVPFDSVTQSICCGSSDEHRASEPLSNTDNNISVCDMVFLFAINGCLLSH